MDTFIYTIGYIAIIVVTFGVSITMIQSFLKGFSPTSITVTDNQGVKYWVPNRIYHAISWRHPFNIDGGNYQDFYENIANNNPQRLIEVTEEHNTEWMWQKHREFQNDSCSC
jgi:hypothetical protein